jgi:hypothetical protein
VYHLRHICCILSDTICALRIAGDTKNGRLAGCQASRPPSSRSASPASLTRSGGDGMIGPSPRNDRPDGDGFRAVATSAPAPLATPEPAGNRPAAPGPRQPCAMDRLEAVSPQRQLLADCRRPRKSASWRPDRDLALANGQPTSQQRAVRRRPDLPPNQSFTDNGGRRETDRGHGLLPKALPARRIGRSPESHCAASSNPFSLSSVQIAAGAPDGEPIVADSGEPDMALASCHFIQFH